MPSVRYAPTANFSQHSSGAKLEQIKFIIIDDDLGSVFCPGNLSGISEKIEHDKFLQLRLEEEKDGLTSIKCTDPPVAPNTLINGRFCANITKAKGYLHTSAGADKDDTREQERNEQQKGKELLRNLHSCYHQSQLSNITKFICWPHSSTGQYTPEIALLFKEGPYSTAKFDWQQSPHAAVFMYNDYGGIDKLLVGDDAVSGLEFVSLGEPIGKYTVAPGDTPSFVSLIPCSNSADQIFDALMDQGARQIQRPQWGAGSAIISSSQSTNDGFLMLRDSRRPSQAGRQTALGDFTVEVKASAGKQLVKAKASSRAEMVFNPANSPRRWLPSKMPTQMASKVASLFPGGLSKGANGTEDKNSPPATAAQESTKLKKVRDRLPRLARTQPSRITFEERSAQVPNLDTVVYPAGNDTSTGFRDKSPSVQILVRELKVHDGPGGLEAALDDISITKPLTDVNSAVGDTSHTVTDSNRTLGKLEVPETMHIVGYRRKSFRNQIPSTPKSDIRRSNVLGERKFISSSNLPLSKFDLSGLPQTCVRVSRPPALTKPAALSTMVMTPSATSFGGDLGIGDPIFKDCKVLRGFNPKYPSDVTQRMEFEDRVGGLENWYTFPMVQVAREYLPEGMKDTDWSWTDNDVSGEFIPGGIAW